MKAGQALRAAPQLSGPRHETNYVTRKLNELVACLHSSAWTLASTRGWWLVPLYPVLSGPLVLSHLHQRLFH